MTFSGYFDCRDDDASSRALLLASKRHMVRPLIQTTARLAWHGAESSPSYRNKPLFTPLVSTMTEATIYFPLMPPIINSTTAATFAIILTNSFTCHFPISFAAAADECRL